MFDVMMELGISAKTLIKKKNTLLKFVVHNKNKHIFLRRIKTAFPQVDGWSRRSFNYGR